MSYKNNNQHTGKLNVACPQLFKNQVSDYWYTYTMKDLSPCFYNNNEAYTV